MALNENFPGESLRTLLAKLPSMKMIIPSGKMMSNIPIKLETDE